MASVQRRGGRRATFHVKHGVPNQTAQTTPERRSSRSERKVVIGTVPDNEPKNRGIGPTKLGGAAAGATEDLKEDASLVTSPVELRKVSG